MRQSFMISLRKKQDFPVRDYEYDPVYKLLSYKPEGQCKIFLIIF